MKCPYCKNEMKQGTLGAYASGTIPIAWITWTSNEELAKTGVKNVMNRKSIRIKNSEDKNSWHCLECHKAFGEFQTE